jgi:hypothetical protein
MTASSNTLASRRRIRDQRHATPRNRETLPLIRYREEILEKASSGLLRGSSEDKASSPSSSTVASLVPFSSNHIYYYYGFVFEFIPLFSSPP